MALVTACLGITDLIAYDPRHRDTGVPRPHHRPTAGRGLDFDSKDLFRALACRVVDPWLVREPGLRDLATLLGSAR